ncbi:MAG: biopolymer transporter ExbD [Loktanella sp.]|nr:biopolymer transporter ExbD [Loktanella sp.]
MPRSGLRRRRLSLTSLIDVIFLLLLFFMLSSTFTRYGDLPFLAATGGAGAAETATPVFLRVQPDSILLNVAEVTLADLPAALTAQDAALVLIAPSDGVSAQRLVDVLVIAQTVPGVSLRLIGG